MNKISDGQLNQIVVCPCCKRKVRQGQMMCRLPMCAECFRTKESEKTE
jgi:hypothetical protein